MINIKVGDNILPNVGLMIFDRDGTLIDLYHYWAQMIVKRAEEICNDFNLGAEHQKKLTYEMGVDEKNKRLRPEGPVGIKKREMVMQAAIDYLHSIGIAGSYDACVEAFKRVDKWSEPNLRDLIKPLDGLYELFGALVEHSCRIAIATTDKTERAKLSMNFLNLSEKVDFVIGADGVENPKPASDMIDLTLEKLKLDKSDAVMVGDAETDIRMGINAGVKACIAVCSGITPREQLTQLTNYVVEDISNIEVL